MIACQGWSYTTVREWEPSPVPDPCPHGSNQRRVLKSTERPDIDAWSRGLDGVERESDRKGMEYKRRPGINETRGKGKGKGMIKA